MAEPMPPKRRLSLSEFLTVDDLINFVSSKAHTRRGRVVVGASSLVLLAAIIFVPIMIRSNQNAGPSSTPAVPVVTVPPSTGAPTAFVEPTIPIDTALNDHNRYGERPETATPATAAPPATTAPTTTAPPATTPVTAPPATTPATFPQPTYPPATNPPATTPATTPLTLPPGGVTVGG